MDVNSIFLDVCDRVVPEQNGSIVFSKFNRFSKLAELRLLNWLSGNITGDQNGYPTPYTTEKSRDFLAPVLRTDKKQVQDGIADRPDDYYLFERMAIIGDRRDELCGEDVIITGVDTPIELLDAAVFDSRSQTYIKSLKPSLRKPIAKLVGKVFHFLPVDIGSIIIEYKAYPTPYGELKTTVDPVYNIEVVDTTTSVPYVWDDSVREDLIFFITQFYAGGTRETALVQQNAAIGKTATP